MCDVKIAKNDLCSFSRTPLIGGYLECVLEKIFCVLFHKVHNTFDLKLYVYYGVKKEKKGIYKCI